MRFIFYFAFITFTLLCIIIAVSNNSLVNFSLEPLPVNIVIPKFWLVFVGIFIGLLGGWIVSIYSSISQAKRRRLTDKKIKELERKIKSSSSPNIDL